MQLLDELHDAHSRRANGRGTDRLGDCAWVGATDNNDLRAVLFRLPQRTFTRP
jgi:hypothetical protein